MENEDAPKKFPESEVDKLIADFGRKPDKETIERVEAMIEAQRPKYEALDQAVKKANKPEKNRKLAVAGDFTFRGAETCWSWRGC